MSYYQLPRVNFFISKNIDYIVDDKSPDIMISHSLSRYLYEIKQRLETIEHDWDIHKKYTNPYEYIHTPLSEQWLTLMSLVLSGKLQIAY